MEIKEHGGQQNSAAHYCVPSFWTTMKMYCTHDRDYFQS